MKDVKRYQFLYLLRGTLSQLTYGSKTVFSDNLSNLRRILLRWRIYVAYYVNILINFLAFIRTRTRTSFPMSDKLGICYVVIP